MAVETILRRMNSRLVAYIERHVTLAGAEKREEVLELFDGMQRLFPHWVIMTCPVMHPDMHYVSENGTYVLGHDKVETLNSGVEKYFACVHPADMEDLQACFAHVNNFLETIPAEWHYQYRCVFHYRFRKQNGDYLFIHDEKAALNLPGSGNFYYTMLRDITYEQKFTGVKVDLYKQDLLLHKIEEFKPSVQHNPLTKREEELIALIKRGLSTKEIAAYLNISHNTVRNIKSKMFGKYNVNNSIELLNVTG